MHRLCEFSMKYILWATKAHTHIDDVRSELSRCRVLTCYSHHNHLFYDALKSVSWVITGCIVINHRIMVLLIDHCKGRCSSTLRRAEQLFMSTFSAITAWLWPKSSYTWTFWVPKCEPSNVSQVHYNHAAVVCRPTNVIHICQHSCTCLNSVH